MEQELRFGLDLGRMADIPAFIVSKSFDLLNHRNLYIWMYEKYMKFERKHNFL